MISNTEIEIDKTDTSITIEQITIPDNFKNDVGKICFIAHNVLNSEECQNIINKTDQYFEEEKKDDE